LVIPLSANHQYLKVQSLSIVKRKKKSFSQTIVELLVTGLSKNRHFTSLIYTKELIMLHKIEKIHNTYICAETNSLKIKNLLKKPNNGGSPAKESRKILKIIAIIGLPILNLVKSERLTSL
jgi:hypothetical protein